MAAEVGVAPESNAQSSADVDAACRSGSSRHTNMENLQLVVGVVYDYGGAHFWMMWRFGIGGLPANCIIYNFNK